MDEEKFVLRDEPFGYTLFDKRRMRHKFIARGTLSEELCFNDVKVKSYEKWDADLSESLDDIIYSPIRMYFELTSACNLRCKTCFNQSGKPKPGELTTEEVKRTLEGFRNDNVFDVRFSGGELTARPDWFELLKYAKDLGFSISFNKQHNDMIRGKGNYEKAEETVKALGSAGCRVTINSVVTSILDESDIRGLLELANDYCRDISFFHARPLGRALIMKDKLLSYYEINEFMDKVEQIRLEFPNLSVRTRSSSLKQNAINQSSAADFSLIEGGTDGFTRFNIMSNGDMYAGGCVPYVDPKLRQQLVLGNIVDEHYSLLNIWRNNERLNRIRQESLKHKQKCNSCRDYDSKCHGFTLEMELYNNIHGNNPYCIKSRGD